MCQWYLPRFNGGGWRSVPQRLKPKCRRGVGGTAEAVPLSKTGLGEQNLLDGILKVNDAALLASALGDIARARGMSEIAKSAGITREALYKALRQGSAPRFDTVSRFCAALGVKLVVEVT